jgi:hypothetical protein
LENWKIGKLGKIGKLENWKIFENWKIGKLEIGKLENWKIGKLEDSTSASDLMDNGKGPWKDFSLNLHALGAIPGQAQECSLYFRMRKSGESIDDTVPFQGFGGQKRGYRDSTRK